MDRWYCCAWCICCACCARCRDVGWMTAEVAESVAAVAVAAVPAPEALALALALALAPRLASASSAIMMASICVVRSGDDGSGVEDRRASEGDGSTVAVAWEFEWVLGWKLALAKMPSTRALLLRPLVW